jgi:SAM-dependent methyltransferase
MRNQPSLDALLSRLSELECAGGPTAAQYEPTEALFDEIAALRVSADDDAAIARFRLAHPSFSVTDTMHGHVCSRPHGYPGDFEIIDRIYQHRISANPALGRWDEFFHWGEAARAVRGRKTYCIERFVEAAAKPDARILNIASGPCRDVLEFKQLAAAATCRIHCVDLDGNAVAFARDLLADHSATVSFAAENAFRLRLERAYDLVWSAGLFDYLPDRLFVPLLRRLGSGVAAGGELIVGNFRPALRSRAYMEFGEWRLTYRDEARLTELALAAGYSRGQIAVDTEATGVNHFLRIRH